MERGEGVLAHGLDGHRKNLLVPVSLEQSFGVRAVVLAPASIRPYEVRGDVVFYIESRRFLIRDSPRPATTYEQKTGGADGVKGA